MKNLRAILCLLVLSIITLGAFAQPQSGLKISTNTTFVKNDKDHSYKPKVGFGLSYQQAIRFTDKWYLSIGAGYNKYSVDAKFIMADEYPYYPANQSMSAEYITAPIVFHYTFKKLYVSLGYQYGYHSDIRIIGNDYWLNSNLHDHSALVGISYNLEFVNISLEYTSSLNQSEKEQTISYSSYYYGEPGAVSTIPGSKKLNVIQLSLTIPFSKKGRNEK